MAVLDLSSHTETDLGGSNSPIRSRASVPVAAPESVYAARNALRRIARDLALPQRTVEELAVVISELATNIMKYASRGRIEVSLTGDLHRGPGIMIIAEDDAPMFDLASALPDRTDASGAIDPARLFGRRGIGSGLGAVSRLTDTLSIGALPSGGKRITAVRFARSRRG